MSPPPYFDKIAESFLERIDYMTDLENQTPTIPDLAERAEALDPTKSFIVQAPAGSGKTELLTRRLLILLSMVKRPEDILTVTFTKKAAREMRNRVLDTLRRGVSGEGGNDERAILAKGVIEKDRAEGWNLLENPERLNIGTIDSFCTRIATQMPILSEIGSLRTITDAAVPLYRRAANRLIMKIDDDTPIGSRVRFALSHMENSIETFVNHMVDILAKRDQWTRHIKRGEIPKKEELEASLRRLIEAQADKLNNMLPDGLKGEILYSARWAAQNIDKEEKKAASIIALGNSDRFPANNVTDIPLWQYVADFLLTDKGAWRSIGGVNKKIGFPADKTGRGREEKEAFQGILEELMPNRRLEEALKDVRGFPANPEYSPKQWEVLETILTLLPPLEGELKEVFNEERKIDFIGISEGAIEALGTDELPTEILLNLDMQLQHILVDEYQDTSRTHQSLIKKLTLGWEEGDGRSLFIVGDPMQSIYLFREAEVGLFIDAWQNGIGDIKLTTIRLKTNFRSGRPIIDWVNRAFTPRFPIKSNSSLGIVDYAPSITSDQETAGEVRTHVLTEKDDKAEANLIVGLIKEIRAKNEGDEIAILVRSRKHLNNIVPYLKRERILYSAQKIDKLPEKQIIRDIYSLLKAIISPFDTVSWLSILRAPWCGLTLAEMNKLVYDRPKEPIWKIIQEEKEADRGRLPPGKRGNLLRLIEQLEEALRLKGRLPIRRIVEGIWLGVGGAACIDEGELKDADTIFALMDTVSEGGNIIDIDTFDFMVGELYAAPCDKGEKILKIMTIHDSKGLEFDHVIIPGLGKTTGNNDKDLFIWLEDEKSLALAPIGGTETDENDPIYSFLNGIRLEKEKYERARLLYVASTRAKKGLYIFGHTNRPKETSQEEPKPLGASLLNSIWDNLPLEEKRPCPPPVSKEAERAAGPRLKRLKIGYKSPTPPKSVIKETKRERIPSTADPVKNYLGGGNETAKKVGTVIHRYLKRISEEGIDKWSDSKVEAEMKTITAIHRELGTPAEDMQSATDKTIEILKKTIDDERGRWILGQHEGASSELSIAGLYNGELVHGIIDRTFIGENGVRYIVDYKTSSPNGEEIGSFPEEEKRNYSKQLLLYSQILRLSGETREIQNGLFFPAIAGWIEWTADK
ncbi:MAG: UvrD-helicase domain-containing protein [Nitrospinae bacterium]|nr:UvrD-helicase domain-containing protein [Nitrospinota bacterium]